MRYDSKHSFRNNIGGFCLKVNSVFLCLLCSGLIDEMGPMTSRIFAGALLSFTCDAVAQKEVQERQASLAVPNHCAALLLLLRADVAGLQLRDQVNGQGDGRA